MQDFRGHLAEQLDFLRSSAAAYDRGIEHEAKRLSATIRTLVHDTGRSTSLLHHLGVKNRVGFVDRGPPEPPPGGGHVIHFGVCIVRMQMVPGGDVRYQPVLGNPSPERVHPPMSFKDWWRAPILRDQQGNSFTREELVLALANKDGGAHIDAALDEAYEALTRDNSMGFTQGEDNRPITNSLVHASVRHIAYELLETIEGGMTRARAGAVRSSKSVSGCGPRGG